MIGVHQGARVRRISDGVEGVVGGMRIDGFCHFVPDGKKSGKFEHTSSFENLNDVRPLEEIRKLRERIEKLESK